MNRRVVVTGGSIISALGNEWDEIFASLKQKKNKIKYMPEWEKYQGMNTRLACPVDFKAPDFPRKKTRGMGRIALMAVTSADNALKDAGLYESPELKAGRCGVSYGSSAGSIDSLLDFYSMLITNTANKISATTYIKMMPQTCAANISVFYGLTGRLITTNTACTSGSMSIGYAFENVRNGYQDIMLAGGAEELSPADSAVFDVLFAASGLNDKPELTPKAYDKNRDGLVIGEGSGTIILEEYEHAVARGAKIYAEMVGFGTNTDGTHITQPNKATMRKAMELALESAGLTPDKIGYVNTHGTATLAGDVAESHATYEVFGGKVPVSTIKNYIGHTLGACGVIEAWTAINMMREGWFAPNINLTEVDPACAPLDYIVGDGRETKVDYIMSNNFAFGGINTSLIFKRFK
ncbi:MAG: beta-ketoacyl-ACP synthase [Spirochaetia bacterium]|nr:beta-ketoacyl-ACP synthase [Spirochaetia bacterium]MBQ3648373.1 beta-ketoacyl-ACP synthase [Spirochaetia bacterium]MBQ3712822.1 beta-ketoacyl-ACP synthase [Spirochaetia bacterium]